MSEGDIVIIHSDKQPRGLWSLGKVKKLLVGNDGEVQGAVLRVAGQGRRAKFLRRPVQKLYPLEMPSHDRGNVLDNDYDDDLETEPATSMVQQEPRKSDSTQPLLPPRRSSRAAALEARDRLLARSLYDSDSS